MKEASQSPPFQFRLRTLFIVTVLVTIPLAGCVVWNRMMERFFHSVYVGTTGPVNTLKDWPRPLTALIDELDAAGLDRNTLKIYCLCRGFDWEFVWRMEGDASMLKLLQDKWELTQVADPDWFILKNGRSHNSGVPLPDWWAPQQNDQTTFYANPQGIHGGKGDHIHVAFDAATQTIFVHCWDNF